MEFENILKLIDSVSASKLDSFVYEQNGTKIRMEKKKQKIQINGTPDLAMESAAICAEEAMTDTDTGTQKSGKTITSPLVGVFYAAPSEDADPFVKVGDPVKKGQVVGIVEAMKLMNEIESEYDGIVEEILVKNEETVEYGQPLFRIR